MTDNTEKKIGHKSTREKKPMIACRFEEDEFAYLYGLHHETGMSMNSLIRGCVQFAMSADSREQERQLKRACAS